MSSIFEKAMQKALSSAIRTGKPKIVTDPRTTRKGNTTCAACRLAARKGTPLPPDHANCRCRLIEKPTNY